MKRGGMTKKNNFKEMRKRFFTILLLAMSVNYGMAQLKIQKHQIQSTVLGYEVDYTALLPENYSNTEKYPFIYITDGSYLLNQSKFPEIAAQFQNKNKRSFITILVSHVAPKTGRNRRNYELLANTNYYRFFISELIPAVERKYGVAKGPEDRFLSGLSFGGLNALFFGLEDKGKTFGGIGVMSPAIHPKPYIKSTYASIEPLPIRFFLSSGDHNDNEKTTREIRNILKSKGYELNYNEVSHSHTMKNWNENWLPMIQFLFKN